MTMRQCLFGNETEFGVVLDSSNEVRPAPQELAPAIIDDLAARYTHLPTPAAAPQMTLSRGIASPPLERRIFLANGACLYADIGGHPELASAECQDPWELAAQNVAMRQMIAESAESVGRVYGMPIRVLANNVDHSLGGPRTYGYHLNLLVTKVSLDRAVQQITPLLAVLPVIAGSGKLSFANGSQGFELSQRASFMRAVVGTQTVSSRAMVTRKSETLSIKGARLHLISCDTVIDSWQLALVVGILAVALKVAEHGIDLAGAVTLKDPIQALNRVSCDPSLSAELPLAAGGTTTALEVHNHYAERVSQYLDASNTPEWAPQIVELWRQLIARMRSDPFSEPRLGWVAKLLSLTRQLEGMGLGWQEFAQWRFCLASVRRLKATWPELDPLCLTHSAEARARIRHSAFGVLEQHFAQNGLSWKDFPRMWNAANQLLRHCLQMHLLPPRRHAAGAESSCIAPEKVERARTTPPTGTRAAVRGAAIAAAPAGSTAWWTFVAEPGRRLVMNDPFGQGAAWETQPNCPKKECTP